MDTDIRKLTALELGESIKSKKISSAEAVKIFIDAAKADLAKAASDETKLNAFTEVYEESALSAAKAIQTKIDKGEFLSPIAGVPVAIKDNICSTEGTTTAASKILGGFSSPFDAAAVEKLREAGAIIIGKTNMDEFAMGSSTENSYYGAVRNPWDPLRVPGGSSGGSAAAVSAGLAPAALGSDTGGSVRQPCGFCNLTGIKPTYGSVSRYGLAAYASSLDQIGPMARDARDLAVLLSIISGRDERDSTSAINDAFDFCGILHGTGSGSQAKTGSGGQANTGSGGQAANGSGGQAKNGSSGQAKNGSGGQANTGSSGQAENASLPLKGRKIGLPKSYFALPALDDNVKARVLEAAETLRGLGAEIKEIDLPLLEYGVPAYLVIACAEAVSNLARYDGVKYGYRAKDAVTVEEVYSKSRGEGFGDEVKRRLLFGYFVLTGENYSTYFRQAQKVRGMIQNAYEKALAECDLLLTPVSPEPAFKIGERADDPLKMYIGDIYTASLNLTGLPGAAAPCGFGEGGMPVGMQLVGKRNDDGLILDTVIKYQDVTDFHKMRPRMFSESDKTREMKGKE